MQLLHSDRMRQNTKEPFAVTEDRRCKVNSTSIYLCYIVEFTVSEKQFHAFVKASWKVIN